MTKTAHYNDPILTADDINLEAFRETMQRFQIEASKPRGERNTKTIDDLLDLRYDVITDDQMHDLADIAPGTHPVDYNPTSQWPFPNPYTTPKP